MRSGNIAVANDHFCLSFSTLTDRTSVPPVWIAPIDVLDIWEVERTLGNGNRVRSGESVTSNTRPLLPRSRASIRALRSIEQSARPGLRATAKREPSKETEAIRDGRQHIYCPSEMHFGLGNYVMPVHLVVERPSIDAQDLGSLALISADFLKNTDDVVLFHVTEASYELVCARILGCDQTG